MKRQKGTHNTPVDDFDKCDTRNNPGFKMSDKKVTNIPKLLPLSSLQRVVKSLGLKWRKCFAQIAVAD